MKKQNIPIKTGFISQSEKLRKEYTEKISSSIIKRYNNFLKDKGYTPTNLKKDIEKQIHGKNMKTFDIKTEQPKIEKIIMNKVSNMESKKVCVQK